MGWDNQTFLGIVSGNWENQHYQRRDTGALTYTYMTNSEVSAPIVCASTIFVTKGTGRYEKHLWLKTGAMNTFSMKLKIDNVSPRSESIRVMSVLHANREVYTLYETWLLMIRCKPILAITISFNIIYHCEVTAMVGGYRDWDMKIPIKIRWSRISKSLELMVLSSM